jgi:radical SAM superfamily enzyme YgiQ (UPF0313 family)
VAARADIIVKNEEMMKTLKMAGCDTVSIGIESGSQRILDFLGKGTTVEQNIEAVRTCKKHGLRVVANYMYGIPSETNDDVLMTATMISKMDPEVKSCAYFTPYPGCELATYCEERGLSLLKDFKDFNRYPGKPKIKGVDYDYIRKTRERFGEIEPQTYYIKEVRPVLMGIARKARTGWWRVLGH